MRILIFLIYIVLTFKIHKANEVQIIGKQPTYKGKMLQFYTYANPFTGKDSLLAQTKVDSLGNFKVSFSIKETMLVYSPLQVYRAYLHVQPYKLYYVTMPDYQEKSPADKLNPYFEPVDIQFTIMNFDSCELNFKIQKFDSVYFSLLKKHFNQATGKAKLNDTSILKFSKLWINESSETFLNQYITYKIGLYVFFANPNRYRSLINEYFVNKPVLYYNEAYFDLFNRLFDKYFYLSGQLKPTKEIYKIINEKKSFSQLSNLFKNDPLTKNDTLRELVFIKNIHDEFYSSNFSRSGLLAILDSLIVQTKNPLHKKYALDVKSKILKLMPGYEAPSFELYSKEAKNIRLSDFKGKYVYLNFCSCHSYACLKEFDLIKKVAEKYKNFLTVITIVSDDNIADIGLCTKNIPENWIFLHFGNQPEIMKIYDVRAFPTYFLIDPEGKFIFSPAKSPSEFFELEFFKILRSKGLL